MILKDLVKIKYFIELIVVRLVLLLIWSTSPSAVLRGADLFGWFVFSILRIRRKVVLDNLKLAFPEMTKEEHKSIAKRCYQGFAKTVVDFMRIPIMSRETVLTLCTLREGDREKLDWVLKNGKGCLMVGGHFGSWELMGAYLSMIGYPISLIVGEQHNMYVDKMMNDTRRLNGAHIIQVGMAVRGVLKALRNNGIVVLLADQDARQTNVFVDFLGIKSSTYQGPAAFTLKTGAPILFVSAIRLSRGRMRIELELLRFDHLKGTTPENVLAVTQAHASVLEQYIRQYPDHWFWMHNRWKTKPTQS